MLANQNVSKGEGGAPFDRLNFATTSRGSVFFQKRLVRQYKAEVLKC